MKPNKVKQLLLKSIREIANRREFFQNPDSNFTRIRKLPFEKVTKSISLRLRTFADSSSVPIFLRLLLKL